MYLSLIHILLVLALSRRYVPETRRGTPSRIDWQGTLYLALILCCLLFPVALGPELHWPLWLQLMLVAVLPLLFAMQMCIRDRQNINNPKLNEVKYVWNLPRTPSGAVHLAGHHRCHAGGI